MIIGIDASNISSGGGLTHLKEILSAIPDKFFEDHTIIVWGNSNTLSQITKRDGINLEPQKLLNKNLLHRIYWQIIELTKVAKDCDILFVPGGLYLGKFRPYVTMFRNILPFDKKIREKYRFSKIGIRFYLLEKGQLTTFRKAAGIIFLSKHSNNFISANFTFDKAIQSVINHGISKKFFFVPRAQLPIDSYSKNEKLKLSYISPIDYYKNQVNVAFAIKSLIDKGYPIQMEFAGSAYPNALVKFNRVLKLLDPSEKNIRYIGPVNYEHLPQYYSQRDIFIFASKCETFGQILLEAMAAGLPIACSNKSVMPEILKDAGIYFDPDNIQSIADSLETLILDPILRSKLALKAYQEARVYSWEKCAAETFGFIREVADNYYKKG